MTKRLYSRIAMPLMAVALVGCDDSGNLPTTVEEGPAFSVAGAPQGGPSVYRLLGIGEAYASDQVPDGAGGTLEATCFDVELWDVTQNRRVGTASDCLSGISAVGDGLALTGTTKFDFGNGHHFWTQGLTTVQPTTHGSPNFTHVTGAVDTSGNGIIAGSGRFSSFAATARLSGAVNLSQLDSSGLITFDCLFVVTPM